MLRSICNAADGTTGQLCAAHIHFQFRGDHTNIYTHSRTQTTQLVTRLRAKLPFNRQMISQSACQRVITVFNGRRRRASSEFWRRLNVSALVT